jgi:hypothetical protein
MPYFGTFLLLAPVLWAGSSRTTSGYLYIFGCWLLLIVIAGVLSRHLAGVRDDDLTDDEDG